MNRKQELAVALGMAGAFVAGALMPREAPPTPEPVVIEKVVHVQVPGPVVTVTHEVPKVVYIEKEPTVHPTDCVAMRWRDE